MKEKLLKLINKTDEIEKLFYSEPISAGTAMTPSELIYDVPEFQIWLQALRCELQEIYDRTHNKFIWDSINDMSDSDFNGWEDRRAFNKLKGELFAIKGNIDSYYPQEQRTPQIKTQSTKRTDKEESNMEKQPKIFISHKKEDLPYVARIVHLIEHIGVKQKDIFCSSMPGYGVPNGKDIFEFLREQFIKYNLYVVFVHSSNFYQSPVGLNEMGAAWALRNDHISFLLPNFDFKDMTGVINSREAAIKLDADTYEVKDRLNQFRDTLTNVFRLAKIDGIVWEKARDEFIKAINSESYNDINNSSDLSKEAESLLIQASELKYSQIIITNELTVGKSIQVGNHCYSQTMGSREFSKWDDAIDELLKNNFIKPVNDKKTIFQVTSAGYKYIETKRK